MGCFKHYIEATTTKTGLKVECVLDVNEYETGEKISKKEFEELSWRPMSVSDNIKKWNYMIGA